jgi:hypothetical protein
MEKATALRCDFVSFALCKQDINLRKIFEVNAENVYSRFATIFTFFFKRGEHYKGRCGQSSVVWFLIRRTYLKILPFRYSDTDILVSETCRLGDNFA